MPRLMIPDPLEAHRAATPLELPFDLTFVIALFGAVALVVWHEVSVRRAAGSEQTSA
ncbi:MAG: hypothetical protein QM622_03800 [Microbacterium sp.]